MMDWGPIISFIQGWAFLLAAFGIALIFAISKGRQNLINLIAGNYIALLLYKLFPWSNKISEQAGNEKTEAIAFLALFIILTIFSTWLFSRLMPREYLETAFETIGKKILLAFGAMVLIMTLATHHLPIDSVIPTGTPLPPSLLTEDLSYFWLLLPLIILFLV